MVAIRADSEDDREQEKEDEAAARRWLARVIGVYPDSPYMDLLLKGLQEVLPDLLTVMEAGYGGVRISVEDHRISRGSAEVHRKYS